MIVMIVMSCFRQGVLAGRRCYMEKGKLPELVAFSGKLHRYACWGAQIIFGEGDIETFPSFERAEFTGPSKCENESWLPEWVGS